jgi:hypothetical protein
MVIPPIQVFNAGEYMSNHAIAFGTWIIVGAPGYRPSVSRTKANEATFVTFGYCSVPQSKTNYTLSIALLLFLAIFFAIFLLAAWNNYAFRPGSSPGVAIGTATVLGFSFATAFCITTSDRRSPSQHVFIVMGAMYVAGLLEQVVGVFAACMRLLESSGRGCHSGY